MDDCSLTQNHLYADKYDTVMQGCFNVLKLLACPTRFQSTAYVLEEFVAARKSIIFIDLRRKYGTV